MGLNIDSVVVVVLMLDKKRGRAYRHIMAGLRYHQNEKLSFLTIGFRRGFNPDIRRIMQQLSTRIKRDEGHDTQFFRAVVHENTQSTKNDDRWRYHIHMIWNAPYIKQLKIRTWLEDYAGESVTVRINLIDNQHKRAARYMMQYLGNQGGEVKFTMSRHWLPTGHKRAWDWCKRESRENTCIGLNPYVLAPSVSPVTLFEQWIDNYPESLRIEFL